jgi:hypothetical protein
MSAVESKDVGDVESLQLTEVRNQDGELTDPDAVSLTVRTPAGVEITYTLAEAQITNPETGSFAFNLAYTEDGAWEFTWRTKGGVDLVESGTRYVGIEPLGDPFPDEDFTVAEVWARSQLLKDRYPKGSGDPDLVLLVALAAPLVGSLTGRAIAGTEGEAVPTGLMELARNAIAMKSAALASSVGTAEGTEDSIERGRLRSIAAGSWSESYFGPGEAARGKQLDADPILAELLWALCTEEKKDEWTELWEGKEKGFSVVEAFDYSARPGGY